jgi:hypothetical protein
MINISTQTKEALIVFGIAIAVIYLTTPKSKGSLIPKPDVAPANELANKENALIALDAYVSASKAGESSKALNALNNELASQYGLRVYKQDGIYTAKDSSGKAILKGK